MAIGGLRSARIISALPSHASDTGMLGLKAAQTGGRVVHPAVASVVPGERQQQALGIAQVFNSQPRNSLYF